MEINHIGCFSIANAVKFNSFTFTQWVSGARVESIECSDKRKAAIVKPGHSVKYNNAQDKHKQLAHSVSEF